MPLPHEISATLLLSRPAQVDIERLRQTLEARFSPHSPGFVERNLRLDPLLSARDMHLRVQARDLPLDARQFDTALESGLHDILFEDPATAIARHRAAVTVIVGCGPEPLTKSQAPATPVTQEAFDRLLILAHTAATRLARDSHPLALHWSQSNQILTAPRFDAMADMLFPLPLFLHPHPVREEHDGIEWMTLDVEGAEHLVHRPLRTAPAPVGFGWMMQRVCAFVAHLRASGQRVTEGMAFATADGERFTVHIDGDGGLRLVLEELGGQSVHRPEGRTFFTAA